MVNLRSLPPKDEVAGSATIRCKAAEGRTRELGVRLALVASRPSILRMMLRDGLVLTLSGVTIGLVCKFGLAGLSQVL